MVMLLLFNQVQVIYKGLPVFYEGKTKYKFMTLIHQ